ncbi:hypothetical protein [Haloferula sp. BvORR071]|uniref:hypothetical protein n=1 Tax=Haloferula sp. BvORR071 TaxID=1396141 RepID=UPI00055490B6|nr:hypothetical protein [Haloferula sp. BvORR071]
MKAIFSFAPLAACLLSLSGCAAPHLVGNRNAVRDEQLMTLPSAASLAEVQKAFSPAEPLPGPRISYQAQAAEHPGEYYWIYTYHPKDGGTEPMVHHIVLADRTGEGGKVMWPAKWLDMSPASAAYVLRKTEGQ